ncbi:MAG: pyrroline-5-carboxylate reductase [Candidatus Margulisbacteria bacterium]|nr:pyrroline-5-carboxylate reductase [Candidatus Margulisiibacteriota bacterium]
MINLGIIGFGKMAKGLLTGFLKTEWVNAKGVCIYEKDPNRVQYAQQEYGFFSISLQELCEKSQVIMVCVKPQNIQDLLLEVKKYQTNNPFWISILAGTTIDTYQRMLGQEIQIMRVMPNMGAVIQESMSALTFSETVTSDNKQIGEALFSSVGQMIEVEEKVLDIVTGISGSGPGFLARIAHDIAQVGEKLGLTYAQSLQCISQTMVGTGKLLLKEDPKELMAAITSPKGTTEAGFDAFDASSLDADIQSVILSAVNRAKALSKGAS